jgi:hypothetical protein
LQKGVQQKLAKRPLNRPRIGESARRQAVLTVFAMIDALTRQTLPGYVPGSSKKNKNSKTPE